MEKIVCIWKIIVCIVAIKNQIKVLRVLKILWYTQFQTAFFADFLAYRSLVYAGVKLKM
jgi:hypothetical protein